MNMGETVCRMALGNHKKGFPHNRESLYSFDIKKIYTLTSSPSSS